MLQLPSKQFKDVTCFDGVLESPEGVSHDTFFDSVYVSIFIERNLPATCRHIWFRDCFFFPPYDPLQLAVVKSYLNGC